MKVKLIETVTQVCYVEVEDNADEDVLIDRAWEMSEDMRWVALNTEYRDSEVLDEETWLKEYGGSYGR